MKYLLLSLAVVLSAPSFSATWAGKVNWTEGHNQPDCRRARIVKSTGEGKVFRIKNIAGSDINGILISALALNKDVEVVYAEGDTTGCGSEPKIHYVSIKR